MSKGDRVRAGTPRSAWGRWGWAALRRRPGQASGLFVLSLLVTMCLTSMPLMSRVLEQAVIKPLFTLERPVTTSMTITAGVRPLDDARERLDEMERSLGPDARAVYPSGVTQMRTEAGTTSVATGASAQVSLLARDGVCDHLRFTAGRCPRSVDEVAVSAVDVRNHGLALGSVRVWEPARMRDGVVPSEMTIVGVYEQIPDERYWLGGRVGGTDLGNDDGIFLGDWVATEQTVLGALGEARRLFPADARAATVDVLPAAATQVAAARRGVAAGEDIRANLAPLVEEGIASSAQIRVLVPLVLGQTAMLMVAVLVVVARAAAEQRRREAGLARLRGADDRRVRQLLAGELLPPVVAGTAAGAAGALGSCELVRRFVLPAGVPFEVRPDTAIVLLAALVLVVGAVHLAIVQTARGDVGSLLQRVRRLPARTGPVTWVAVALAGAAAVVVTTSPDPTPLALATPTLLALALGLVVSHLVPGMAGRSTRRAVARGRMVPGLALAGVARRSSTRGVLVVVTVAICAVIVAVDAWAVGERNRTLRAELESGAGVALVIKTADVATVEQIVAQADPSARSATVVALTRPRDRSTLPTLAVRPDSFRSVAFPSTLTGVDFSQIAPSHIAPVHVQGRTLSVTLDTDLTGVAATETVEIRVVLTTPSGRVVERPLEVPVNTPGPVTVSTALLCDENCRLDRLVVDGPEGSRGPLRLVALAVDGSSLPVIDPRRWQPGRSGTLRTEGDGGSGVVAVVDDAGSATLVHADAPDPVPVVTVGDLPAGSEDGVFDAKGVTGGLLDVRRVGTAPQLPVLGARGLLVDMDLLARRGVRLDPDDHLEVWISPGRPDLGATVREALTARGIEVVDERSFDAVKARYDASGSAWGLTIALLGAVLSALVAAGFLAVSTLLGWRAVSADVAALTTAGVSPRVVRRALLLEHLAVITAGAMAGAVAGLVGAHLALPMLPLFTRPAPRPVPRLDVAYPHVVAAWVVLTAGLGLIAAALTRALTSRTDKMGAAT